MEKSSGAEVKHQGLKVEHVFNRHPQRLNGLFLHLLSCIYSTSRYSGWASELAGSSQMRHTGKDAGEGRGRYQISVGGFLEPPSTQSQRSTNWACAPWWIASAHLGEQRNTWYNQQTDGIAQIPERQNLHGVNGSIFYSAPYCIMKGFLRWDFSV